MMKIEKEPFSAHLFDEILPLAQKCWNESTIFKADTCAYYGDREFQIEPDFESYQRFADNGWVVVVTLREDGYLRGYIVGLLYKAMHHKHVLAGLGDTAYVEPDYRSYTGPLTERFEKEMKNLGVAIIGWPVHRNGPLFELLKSRGYTADDTVMEKRL